MISLSFTPHVFHIPVMGLGYTIDTPLKVARYGIASVVSIIEDHLIERMRENICKKENIAYVGISDKEHDYRARRIREYLNLMNELVAKQMQEMRTKDVEKDPEIRKYFGMLATDSPERRLYDSLQGSEFEEKSVKKGLLRNLLVAGSIDVNIMTKVDRPDLSGKHGEKARNNSDALSALRGFATSDLCGSVIFSAGMNPRLYGYCSEFPDFFPNENGEIKKKIVLKVSDYRSALIQGKFLGKKGLWVSEFRIESGINCGGHAFISNGVLMGPILEEFKNKRAELFNELYKACNDSLQRAGKCLLPTDPCFRITAQGGVGTSFEQTFLMKHYQLDSIGWGSPFLLVPEATSVDDDTLQKLATATRQDYYLSSASPLGIPFHNFRKSTSERQRNDRILKGRPGSPCYKKFLASNSEFTSEPICTASRQYQKLKIDQLSKTERNGSHFSEHVEEVLERDCLCEGLGASALIKNKMKPSHKLTAVTICPGPNLAFFSGTFTLRQMVDHIYGRKDLLKDVVRPFFLVNELQLYFDYFKKEVENDLSGVTEKGREYFIAFKNNLLAGIDYYEGLLPKVLENVNFLNRNLKHLNSIRISLNELPLAMS